ncbi:unnamed protein product [Peniophora sp. CBMAI 1063]|nr:unnamed protein product [Peniophora sp. CBMAI 1063]
MSSRTLIASPLSLSPDLTAVVMSGSPDGNVWSLSRELEAIELKHDAILRQARVLNDASAPLAFLQALYGAGCGIGHLAERISFQDIVRLWELLRLRRQTGRLLLSSTLTMSPIEADTVQVKLQNGTLVICAQYGRSSDHSARVFYVFPRLPSGDVDLDLYNMTPTFIRPAVQRFAFSGSESLIATLENESSSYAIYLMYHAALPRSRLPIPAAWRVGQADVRSDMCRLYLLYSLLALFLTNPARLIIWNWKTGVVLLVAQDHELGHVIGFAFLTSQSFMLVRNDGISVYCVPESPAPLSQLECSWLGLPILHESAEVCSVKLHTSEGDPGTRSEITLRERMCVLMVTVTNVETHETREIVIFAKSASILDACRHMPQSRERVWDDWGPQYCRALHLEGYLRLSVGGVRGLRAVLQQWLFPPGSTYDEAVDARLIIFDFGDVQSLSGIEDILPGTAGANRGAVRRASSLELPGLFKNTVTMQVAFAYVITDPTRYYGIHTCPNEVLLDDRRLVKVFSTYDEMQQAVELEVFDA